MLLTRMGLSSISLHTCGWILFLATLGKWPSILLSFSLPLILKIALILEKIAHTYKRVDASKCKFCANKTQYFEFLLDCMPTLGNLLFKIFSITYQLTPWLGFLSTFMRKKKKTKKCVYFGGRGLESVTHILGPFASSLTSDFLMVLWGHTSGASACQRSSPWALLSSYLEIKCLWNKSQVSLAAWKDPGEVLLGTDT